ncbi:hypothetical protein RJ639_009576 [Escallonia herrerae]|uniref:Chalcone/stilbene synthase N-terminal domain-containing protein n=1 Tax=Escallonia herrerae TaxID=1293975 RepID=A0AA88VY46_9ASTE|nr:hypothetical protein RJ639_009576 [Escallonia herrerae]
MASSLDASQDMVVVKIPKLGKEASVKAIKKWGQPKSKITYPISSSTPTPASTSPAVPSATQEWDQFGNDSYAIPEVQPIQSTSLVQDALPLVKLMRTGQHDQDVLGNFKDSERKFHANRGEGIKELMG